jgi:hypothetical protein
MYYYVYTNVLDIFIHPDGNVCFEASDIFLERRNSEA